MGELSINLSAFNEHLMQCLKRDFSESTQGITDRIVSLGASFSYINFVMGQNHEEETSTANSDSGCLAHLENIMAVIFTITSEIADLPLIDFKFVEKFLKLTQDRLEYIYNTLLLVGGTFIELKKPTDWVDQAKRIIASHITP